MDNPEYVKLLLPPRQSRGGLPLLLVAVEHPSPANASSTRSWLSRLTYIPAEVEQSLPDGVEVIEMGGLSAETDWTVALSSVGQVVHLTARVHVMNDKSTDPLVEFRQVNVEGTANLARRAAAAGVGRFVYLSSIKVKGEFTEFGLPLSADDVPAPDDPYGVSKHEAEQALRWIAAGGITGQKTVRTTNARTRSNNRFSMYAANNRGFKP